jgi:hypothetical protein
MSNISIINLIFINNRIFYKKFYIKILFFIYSAAKLEYIFDYKVIMKQLYVIIVHNCLIIV